MQIASYLIDSFTEYEGEHSLVIFTKECNLNCYGCYNKDKMLENSYSFESVLKENITPLHSAVVLLGGEPTCNPDILNMIGYVKQNYPDLKLKMYTNGLKPQFIFSQIVDNLDAFSVDFKCWNSNSPILGIEHPNYREKVLETLKILHDKGKLSEVRTLLSPKLKSTELQKIQYIMKNEFPDVPHILSKFIEVQ